MSPELVLLFAVVAAADGGHAASPTTPSSTPAEESAPVPLVAKGQAVDWWFVFKFNAADFPGCSKPASCPFGGTPLGGNKPEKYPVGEQFVFASSKQPQLKMGNECLGEDTEDPLGATFDEVYNGGFNYVVWNDQFKGDPLKDQDAPWGHSKGMLAWDDKGEGLVMQVSTPSWPGAGSKSHPRKDGNTLGCVKDDDVEVSQHFFALRLSKKDLLKVLAALANATVVTSVTNPQLVKNGGPKEVQDAVKQLGKLSTSKSATREKLSSGVLHGGASP